MKSVGSAAATERDVAFWGLLACSFSVDAAWMSGLLLVLAVATYFSPKEAA